MNNNVAAKEKGYVGNNLLDSVAKGIEARKYIGYGSGAKKL